MKLDEPVILIVDDSANDVLLMRIVFERVGLARPLQFARGVDEAMAYLERAGRYRDREQFPLPSVVLLDLNMPGKNGFELLEWVRRRPEFRRLPIFMLSASNRPEDIERAYELGANSYLLKPRNLDGLMRAAKTLVAWLKISHFSPLKESERAAEPAAAEDLGSPVKYHQDRLVG